MFAVHSAPTKAPIQWHQPPHPKDNPIRSLASNLPCFYVLQILLFPPPKLTVPVFFLSSDKVIYVSSFLLKLMSIDV